MINALISWSIRNRAAVAALSLLLAAFGFFEARRLDVDVLPDLNRPVVTIMTECHGMVPVEVERRVTIPLEQALTGVPGSTLTRSVSAAGLSIVNVEFDWGADIYRSRQLAQERLQLANDRLPEGIAPELAPVSSVMGQVRIIGLRSNDPAIPPTRLRDLADQVVRPCLLSVPGVAQVSAIGASPLHMQVVASSDGLLQHGVSLQELKEAVSAANLSASGGMMRIGSASPLVLVPALAADSAQIEDAVVRPDPARPVRVRDVARVEFGPALVRTGDASVDGEPGVVITVYKQPETDTISLDRRIEAVLSDLTRSLPEWVEVVPSLYRQAGFIERSIANVEEAIRDGAILVVAVLALFLLNVRTTLITLAALPLSLAVTAVAFSIFGLSINTMTLGGLAIAIGCLVDDAIVDVENVFRRLRENRAAGMPRNPLDVVYSASVEVRGPVIVGTALVCVVYVPLFAMQGLEGRLFTPIGVAYVASIASSLLVAMTLTPALCAMLLPSSSSVARRRDPVTVRALKTLTGWIVGASIRNPAAIGAVLTASCVAAAAVMFTRGADFLPPFDEGAAQVNILLPPGTGIDAADEFGRRKDRLVMSTPGVEHAGRRTGRSSNDSHAHAVNFSETLITFDPRSGRTREEVLSDLRAGLKREFPGVSSSAEQPLQHALSHVLSGVNAQVAVKVRGPDLDVLRSAALRIEEALSSVPGVVDLARDQQALVPQVEITPRREVLSRFGLRVADLTELVELAMEGEEISTLNAGQQRFPITMMLDPRDRADLDKVRSLLVDAQGGDKVRLLDVADVRLTLGPGSIGRENGQRFVAVQHNIEGRPLVEVASEVAGISSAVVSTLPPGYSATVGGQYEAQTSASRVIAILSVAAALLIFGILYLHFGSVNLAVQVMAKLPPSMIGGVAMLVILDQSVSVAALVGFIALAGIISRNGVLLIDHYMHLIRGGEPADAHTIIRAGKERASPVLMTALSAGIALVPILVAGPSAGRELLYPVAAVIAGGLVTSTLLDFVFTPAVFFAAGRGAAARLAGRKAVTAGAQDRPAAGR